MIAIVDNGKNAERIAQLVRGSKIVKPGAVPTADAYILSDGQLSAAVEKANVALVKANKVPILGIGVGYLCIGLAYGAKTRAASCSKTERITVTQRSPILLDLKKNFTAVSEQKMILDGLPPVLGAIAECPKNPNAVIQHGANLDNPIDSPLPIFGVHFNPELGMEGIVILNNFSRFVEMWKKYH
jgi:anthranilate/para-aminobenzoate synthase component II